MPILLIIAVSAFALALLTLLLKLVERRWGLPRPVTAARDGADETLLSLHSKTRHGLSERVHELLEALSRVPHLLIHLAYVLRDKFRDRFSHYIDEVKGKKPLRSGKPSNSPYLNAVKEHHDDSEGGEIH